MFTVCSSIANSPDNLIVLMLYSKKNLIEISVLIFKGLGCTLVVLVQDCTCFPSLMHTACTFESSDLGGC
jgi:hypothetical protein